MWKVAKFELEGVSYEGGLKDFYNILQKLTSGKELCCICSCLKKRAAQLSADLRRIALYAEMIEPLVQQREPNISISLRHGHHLETSKRSFEI
jgi:hypothetical protein